MQVLDLSHKGALAAALKPLSKEARPVGDELKALAHLAEGSWHYHLSRRPVGRNAGQQETAAYYAVIAVCERKLRLLAKDKQQPTRSAHASPKKLTAYEQVRAANMATNAQKLRELGL